MTLFRLALRNALRNKVRLTLAVAGVAVALLAFVTLRTAVGSWDSAAALARRDRLVTRQKMTFIMPLPKRYVADLRATRSASGASLVAEASFASWFGGRDPARPNAFFASYAIEGKSYFDVYDEMHVDLADVRAFEDDRSGAIVGASLARDMGWKRGDRVLLESPIYPSPDRLPFAFTVRGFYESAGRSGDEKLFLFHWERLDAALPTSQRGTIGWIVSRTPAGASTDDVAAAARTIDAMFAERETETLTQDERAFTTGFLGMASAVMDVLSILSFVVLGIQGLVLANAMGMSVRERSREYASLRSMGFSRRWVARLVLTEAALVGALGAVVGAFVAWLAVGRGLAPFFERDLSFFFPVFRVTPGTLALAVGVALVTAIASGVTPAIGTARARLTEAMRRVA
ncbi:MAG: FtsX-like permease family protein [Polyangiaceae bacterium]|nr:FtsX-like permease family protein [Polyangiaceae bacterium]